jgi:DNA-binding IclR family transcriptional regulator
LYGWVKMQGIQRQVALLDAISGASESGISITDLYLATGLPKGTVHRVLASLQEHGIVLQEEDSKRWRLGPKVAFWAGKYLEGPMSLAPLRRFVVRLSEEAQFFTYLTVLDQGELVCVAVERPESKPQFFVQLGSRVPILYTAAGRALLAYQPEEVAQSLVKRETADHSRICFETVTVESYLEELAETRRRGYAKCMEELEVGVSALGAAITDTRGRSVASLTVVAPTAALMEDWEATAEKLQHIAEEASMTLGRERENEVARW